MSNIIQLNHQAENTYEFDVDVEGLQTSDIDASFVIIVKGMELAFPCVQDNMHFTCKIPPIPFIEKTAYKGAVRIVADGYFFEVVSDLLVNVTGNLNFERNDVKHMTVKTTIGGEVHTYNADDHEDNDDVGDVHVNTMEPKTISNIAQRMLRDSTDVDIDGDIDGDIAEMAAKKKNSITIRNILQDINTANTSNKTPRIRRKN